MKIKYFLLNTYLKNCIFFTSCNNFLCLISRIVDLRTTSDALNSTLFQSGNCLAKLGIRLIMRNLIFNSIEFSTRYIQSQYLHPSTSEMFNWRSFVVSTLTFNLFQILVVIPMLHYQVERITQFV